MNEFKTVLKEYQEIKFLSKIHVEEMIFLLDKVNSFKNGIESLEEHIYFSLKNNSDEFDFMTSVFTNSKNEIHNCFLSYNEEVLIPLKNIIQNFNVATEDCLTSFNQMKANLIENKQKLEKAKEVYYNFIKSNNSKKDDKDDQNELYKAKKDNYAQLYKYEVDKMNEIILQNNKKYNEILLFLDGIDDTAYSIVNNSLLNFSKIIENLGHVFVKFSEKLKEGINTNKKTIENQRYKQQTDEISNLRFNLEKFEEYGEEKTPQGNPELNSSNEIKETKVDKSLLFRRLMSLPRKGFDDFEVIDTPIEIMDQTKMLKHVKEFTDIIKKLASETELSPTEVSSLLNILKEDSSGQKETLSFIFLMKIKKFYRKRVKNFKNRNNFIHLANILNNLCIKEDNTKTYNAIIEVSQMIKYENLFLYSMILKKNQFLRTKTFWLKIFQDNLIDNIIVYSNKLFNNEITINNDKICKKTNIIMELGLNTKISNYNKLNEQQKNNLENYAYETICKILSNGILGMSSFLVPEFTSSDIIEHYCKMFHFDKPTLYYFHNLLQVKNIKNTLGSRKDTDSSNQKKIFYERVFIISCALKYLPKNEYLNLLLLNKAFNTEIEKKIFKLLLSNDNLTIEKRIELWGIILRVKRTMSLISYKEVKDIMKERIDEKLVIPKTQESRNLDTIRVDLIRTPFINQHQEHIDKVTWILRCLNYIKPDIGYYQGMNTLTLFFYQLLDYDEEKTFYYLYSFERETKYEIIFKEDLRILKIFFTVLDKILNLYKPEIYYKFVDNYLSTNIYSTPWFVTVFTNISGVFNKKDDASKFVMMVIENFIIDGWSAVFNTGFTLTNYYFDKIMKIEREELINFMIKDFIQQDIVNNENFSKIKRKYEKNSELINEYLINKLVKITTYENSHEYLKNKSKY